MDLESTSREVKDVRDRILKEIGSVVVGMEEKVDLLLAAVLAQGHVLFEGVPGVAKTLLAKMVAGALGCSFNRIQFTPDLLPGDITGTPIFDRNKAEFVFRRGPIFAQILLADEINRAPAKTQSALLEAMQENQVTVDTDTYQLGKPFLVIATQNPIEQEGVYRLPEAQLDRFFLRVLFFHPSKREEIEIMKMHSKPVPEIGAVTGPDQIRAWQAELPNIDVKPVIHEYIADLAERSRKHPDIMLGMSPRASLNVLLAAQSWALLQGREYVTHGDVKRIAGPVLNHRLILKPEAEITGRQPGQIIKEILDSLPTVDRD